MKKDIIIEPKVSAGWRKIKEKQEKGEDKTILFLSILKNGISLAGLIGGIAVAITFAYPSFMWLKIKKPRKYSIMWWLNWEVLGLDLAGHDS